MDQGGRRAGTLNVPALIALGEAAGNLWMPETLCALKWRVCVTCLNLRSLHK